MIDKIRNCIGLCILVLYPIMQFITILGIKFNVSVADFLIPLYFVFCLIGVKRFPIRRNLPFAVYFLAYIFIVVISNCYNLTSGVETYGVSGLLSEIVKIATCFGYFVVAYNSFEDEKSFTHVMTAWLIGLWIFMIYGLSNLEWRFLGTFTDANGAGNYLTFSFFVVIMVMFRVKSDVLRVAICITEMMVLLCILATQSRGTWVGFAVGVSLLIIVFWRKLYKLLLLVLPLIIMASLLFIKIDFDTDYSISGNILRRFNEAAEGEGQFVIRKNLSIQSLMMGMDHPVLGVGKGNFNLNSRPYADLLYDSSKNDFIYKEITRSIPHNTFAGIFAELGIVGFIVFSGLFGFFVFKLFKKRCDFNKVLWIAFLAFGVQSLVLCLENARVLWIFLAIGFRMQEVEFPIVAASRGKEVMSFKKIFCNKGVAVLAIVTVAVFLYTAFHVTKSVKVGDTATVFEIPYKKGLKVTYEIKNIPDYEMATLSYVNVYTDAVKAENLINSKIYMNVIGYEIIELINEEADTIKLVFQKDASEGNFEIKNLYYEFADGIKHSLMDYVFVPNGLEASMSALLQVRKYNQNEIINETSKGKKHLSEYINNLDEDKLLLVSVKDEASHMLDGATVAAFRSFGIDFKLPYKARFSYIAVLSKAKVFESFEAISESKAQELWFSFENGADFGSYMLPFDLEIASAGYEVGNYSRIKLDGTDYSTNNRGLNIVVYDMTENCVTEAFTVDTYVSSFYE